MKNIIGEIKLFAYNEIPEGFLACRGQAIRINKYPMLYMMLGNKFGKMGDSLFRLPDMRENTPKDMVYCIAYEGETPRLGIDKSLDG